MNVTTTPTTHAPTSVTTTSEGTAAPVAMVTTWMGTITLARVQIISWLESLKRLQNYGFTLDRSEKGEIEEAEAVRLRGGRRRGELNNTGWLCNPWLCRVFSLTQWAVVRICQGGTVVTSPVPPGLLHMQRMPTVSTPCQWSPPCNWRCTSLKILMWSKALMVNA